MPLAGFDHVFVPASGAPSTRTLILLHGTGGDEHDLIPLARHIAPGVAVLSPRGQVSEHGARRFFRRLAEGVFDIPDLHARTRALAAFVAAAVEEHALDPTGIIAVGFSNGANIAASLLLSHPGVLRGAVLLRAMVPYEPGAALPHDTAAEERQGAAATADAASSRDASRAGEAAATMQRVMRTPARVLISEGRHDPIVPVGQAERLAALLREAGCDVTLEWREAGHQLVQGDIDRARAFLAR